MNYRAFITENEEENLRLEYYPSLKRWNDNFIGSDNPIGNIKLWSDEIKYLNQTYSDTSEEIKNLPKNKGGVYVFYIKGLSILSMENYILYVGRCQYTKDQNIRKRAQEYFKDSRTFIKRMFKHWNMQIYYRYYPDTNNSEIIKNEVLLIRAILPPLNELIPDKIEIQKTVPAFNTIPK